MTTDFTIPDMLYFQHRLSMIAQTPLPATVQFDLARAPVDNAALQQATTLFGAPLSAHQNDWGLSSFLTHLASTQPDQVKTPDLHAVQDRLKQAGFLPSSYAATGIWDSASQGALGQWENQQTNDFYAGHHIGATTTQKAMQALGWMLPSQVFQGLVGAAKGFVQQTPETVERVGAAGGAVAGAAIGASIGALGLGVGAAPGAVVGAIAGAAIGFFGDLLTKSPEEEGQGDLQNLWDAITPYQEYSGSGGFGRFMEDVGWVATASALVAGVGGGIAGAARGVGAIGEEAAQAGTGFWSQAIAKGATEDVGWSTKIAARAARYANADKASQMMMTFAERHGLIAQASRPIISDVIQPLYTGLASAQFASRATSNLGAGENETTIHKAISEAPLLRTGIEIPLLGDIVDLPAFVINPTQFVPWRLGDLTRGITRLVDADPAVESLVNIARRQDPTLSSAAAHAQVTEMLGRTGAEVESSLSMLRLEYGVEAKSYELAAQKFGLSDREALLKGQEGFKDELRLQVNSEIGDEEVIRAAAREYGPAKETVISSMGKPSLLKSLDKSVVPATGSPTLRDLMSYSAADAGGFEAYMERLTTNGSGIEGLRNYFEASKIAKGYTEGVRDGRLVPMGTDGKLMSPGVNKTGTRLEITEAEKNVKTLKQQIDALQTRTDDFVYQPSEVQTNMEAIAAGKKKLKEAEDLLKSLKRRTGATWPDRTVVAERLDTPTVGDYLGWSREHGQITQGMEVALENGQTTIYGHLKQLQLQFLEKHQDLIPAPMLERAKQASKPRDEIGAYFEQAAKSAPEEVIFKDPRELGLAMPGEQGPGLQQSSHDLGYKFVVRHTKNTFEYAVDHRITEVTGINDYTARHTFYQSLGLGVNASTDRSIAQLRSLAMQRSVDQLSQENGWGLSGVNIMARLRRGLNEANYTGVVTNDVARALRERGDPVSLRGGFLIGNDKTIRHFAVDIRDLRPGDVYESLRDIPDFTQQDAAKVFGALQSGGKFGAELNFVRSPLQAANELGRVLRVSGLQGFTDIARSWHIQAPGAEMKRISSQAVKRAVIGAGVGAAAGAIFDDDKMHGALVGAGIGLGAGLGVQALAKRSYGYLPDYLYKVTTALRYSLSPAFDVRRFVKQNLLAAQTHDLPPVMNAPRFIKGKSWKSIYGEGEVNGEHAWTEAKKLWDDLNGVGYNEALDTFDRTLYASGILGYNPMNRQMAHAYMLKARGWSNERISSALKDIYSYGPGRTAMEKSINYVFFPFSFEKKILTASGDFLLQHPARALLLHEGMRRWYDSTWATDMQDFLKDHVPLLSQMREFNAFSHGISPGRFMFQGVGEHRTTEGKAAQLLASFFIPGGAMATPIHEAVGGIGDLAVAAFHPIAVTGESLTRMGVDLSASNQGVNAFLDDIGGRYIPMVKDIKEFYDNAADQVAAIRHGEAPWSQVSDYYDKLGAEKRKLEPFAAAFGYASPDGLMESAMGAPFKAQYQEARYQLQQKYPDAANMADTFDNTASTRQRALADIMHSRDTSSAYTAIRRVVAAEQSWTSLAQNQDPQLAQVYQRQATSQIRAIGLANAGDPRFVELWKQLYEPTYGPITTEP